MRTSLAFLALSAALPAQQLVADPFFQGASRSGPEVWTSAHAETRVLSWGPLVLDITNRVGWPWHMVGLEQTVRPSVAGWYLLTVVGKAHKPSIASQPVVAEVWDGTKQLVMTTAPCSETSTSMADVGSLVVQLEASKDYRVTCRVRQVPTYLPEVRNESTVYQCTLDLVQLPVACWWRRKQFDRWIVQMAPATPPGTDAVIGLAAFGALSTPLKVPGLFGAFLLDPWAPCSVMPFPMYHQGGWGVPATCPPIYGQLVAVDFDTGRWSIGSLTVLR